MPRRRPSRGSDATPTLLRNEAAKGFLIRVVAMPNPHFDDRGAVSWFTDFQTALAEAQNSGKKLFIESGRPACAACRSLVEEIIPVPQIRARLKRDFICLADDCDQSAPQVRALLHHLKGRRILPYLLITDSQGSWLAGSTGSTTAEAFLTLLQSAEPPIH